MRRNLTLNTVSILLLAAVTSSAQDSTVSKQVAVDDKPFLLTYPNLENSDGEVVLTNDHVVLQRLVVGPGEWEGIHSHPGNQIYVHIKGGEWSGRLGGNSEYSGIVSPDGQVGWMDAIPLSVGHDSGNTVVVRGETCLANRCACLVRAISHDGRAWTLVRCEPGLDGRRLNYSLRY